MDERRAPSFPDERSFDGDAARTAALIEQLARSAVSRARSNLEPRDLAQEVLIGLMRRNPQLRTPPHVQDPTRYYAAVVRNGLMRMLRRDAAQRCLLETPTGEQGTGESPEDILLQEEAASSRLAALRTRLRPMEALALDLMLESELDAAELARRLGTSVNNAHQLRHRIRLAIRAPDDLA